MTRIEPCFIAGSAGRLHLIHHSVAPADQHACVVVVPAFAEEMNKARRQVALQARALAADGFGVAIADLYGTGESDGSFADASIDGWVADIVRVCDWVADHRYREIVLLGIRAGALLLAPLLAALPQRVERVVLWQPQTTGKLAVNQFLRLRIAAGMMSGGGESLNDLRKQLTDGSAVETAGYALGPELVSGFDALQLTDLAEAEGIRIDWIDLDSGGESMSPVARRAIDAIGTKVRHHVCAGEAYWGTAEIATLPELISLTCNLLAESG